MTTLVDTSVWSLAFRRDTPPDLPEVTELRRALSAGDPLVCTGLILQELLQGLPAPRSRTLLIERFAALPMLAPAREDHIEAAALRNRCRAKGVQLGTVDALLAQLCLRHELQMLTCDHDFLHAARHCPLRVWGSGR